MVACAATASRTVKSIYKGTLARLRERITYHSLSEHVAGAAIAGQPKSTWKSMGIKMIALEVWGIFIEEGEEH